MEAGDGHRRKARQRKIVDNGLESGGRPRDAASPGSRSRSAPPSGPLERPGNNCPRHHRPWTSRCSAGRMPDMIRTSIAAPAVSTRSNRLVNRLAMTAFEEFAKERHDPFRHRFRGFHRCGSSPWISPRAHRCAGSAGIDDRDAQPGDIARFARMAIQQDFERRLACCIGAPETAWDPGRRCWSGRSGAGSALLRKSGSKLAISAWVASTLTVSAWLKARCSISTTEPSCGSTAALMTSTSSLFHRCETAVASRAIPSGWARSTGAMVEEPPAW